jgi:hypothetical protein
MTTPISVAKLQSCKTRWPCIGGAPCQGRAADEIIVIDDESTDDSVRVIDRFAGRAPSIRVLQNANNTGVIPTLFA